MTYAYRLDPSDEWDQRTRICPMCLGLGATVTAPRPSGPDGSIAVHAPTQHLSMEEIIERLTDA